jgi:hypothetical protein
LFCGRIFKRDSSTILEEEEIKSNYARNFLKIKKHGFEKK